MRLEREVRKLVVEGASQSLSDLLDIVTSRLAAQKDELLGDSLKRIRAALKGEGQIVDCDKAMPFRLVQPRSGRLRTTARPVLSGTNSTRSL